MSKNRRNPKNKSGKSSIAIIVIFLLAVMSVQMVRLYDKNKGYIEQEERLSQQLEDETERQKKIQDYAIYTQSKEYIEDLAHSKLGLVYDNEIVFKER